MATLDVHLGGHDVRLDIDTRTYRLLVDGQPVGDPVPFDAALNLMADQDAAYAAQADTAEALRLQMRDKTDELDTWNIAAGTWLATDGAHGNVDLPHYRALRADVITLGYAYRDLQTKPDRLRAQFDWMTGQSQIATSMLADYNTVIALEAAGLA